MPSMSRSQAASTIQRSWRDSRSRSGRMSNHPLSRHKSRTASRSVGGMSQSALSGITRNDHTTPITQLCLQSTVHPSASRSHTRSVSRSTSAQPSRSGFKTFVPQSKTSTMMSASRSSPMSASRSMRTMGGKTNAWSPVSMAPASATRAGPLILNVNASSQKSAKKGCTGCCIITFISMTTLLLIIAVAVIYVMNTRNTTATNHSVDSEEKDSNTGGVELPPDQPQPQPSPGPVTPTVQPVTPHVRPTTPTVKPTVRPNKPTTPWHQRYFRFRKGDVVARGTPEGPLKQGYRDVYLIKTVLEHRKKFGDVYVIREFNAHTGYWSQKSVELRLVSFYVKDPGYKSYRCWGGYTKNHSTKVWKVHRFNGKDYNWTADDDKRSVHAPF